MSRPHQAFVLAGGAVDRDHGQPPGLSFFAASSVTRFAWFGSISPNAVAPMRHGPGRRHRVLESGADAELRDRALPSLTVRAALIAEAAQVLRACRRRNCGSAECRIRSAAGRRRCGPRTRRTTPLGTARGSGDPSGCVPAHRNCCPDRLATRRWPIASGSTCELSVDAHRNTPSPNTRWSDARWHRGRARRWRACDRGRRRHPSRSRAA